MTTTLQSLYMADPGSREYDTARAAKVAEIAEYIATHVADGVNVTVAAESLMADAEEAGHIDGDDVSGELAGRYTASGNPLTFTL